MRQRSSLLFACRCFMQTFQPAQDGKLKLLRTKTSAMMASHYIQCFKFCSRGLGKAFVRCSASHGQQQDLRKMTTV